ncbi:unnamed protein product [Malus baccata var. baccata]
MFVKIPKPTLQPIHSAAMLMKLKTICPAKFFGNTFPCPCIYTDVKFNDHGSTHLPTSSTPYFREPIRLTDPWTASASSASSNRASSDSPPPAPIEPKR